jgi:hypothetical protein
MLHGHSHSKIAQEFAKHADWQEERRSHRRDLVFDTGDPRHTRFLVAKPLKSEIRGLDSIP